MDGLFDQLASVVGDVMGSAPVRLVMLGVVAYLTVVWLASAHWVYRDMRRRRPDPATPYLAAVAIVLASPVLLPLTVFTYLVLRPGETIAEARERDLTERLDRLEAEMDLACPGCRQPVEEHWILCPGCRTRLAHRCRSCGRTMGLDWALCGWCGAEFGRRAAAQRLPAPARRALGVERSAAERFGTDRRGGLLEPGA